MKTISDPKQLHDSLRRPGTAERAEARDEFTDRNVRLEAWKPFPIQSIDRTRRVTPHVRYHCKHASTAHMAIVLRAAPFPGDLMRRGTHFDPTKTSAQSPSFAAQLSHMPALLSELTSLKSGTSQAPTLEPKTTTIALPFSANLTIRRHLHFPRLSSFYDAPGRCT